MTDAVEQALRAFDGVIYGMSETSTIGELRALISDLTDDMPIIVRSDGERERVDVYVDDGALYFEGFS
jgi:hypothetical protein